MAWGVWTNVERGQSASVTFTLKLFPDATSSFTVQHLGGSASLSIERTEIEVPEYTTPPDWWGEGEGFEGYQYTAQLSLSGSPVLEQHVVLYERGLFHNMTHMPGTWVETYLVDWPYTVSASWDVSGVRLKAQYDTEAIRANGGGITHSTECAMEERWFARDGETAMSVTFGGLSRSYAFTPVPGVDGELDLGDLAWRLSFTADIAGNADGYNDATGDAFEFTSVLMGGAPIEAGQLTQDSDRTWTAGRGWSANDGGDYSATGTGNSIAIAFNATGSGPNTWTGWADVPRAINLGGVEVQTFLTGAYTSADAETDPYYAYDDDTGPLVHTGCLDIDGNELVDEAGVLHGYGNIVSKDVYSWIATSAGEAAAGYVWWSGYNPPATVRLYLDTDWLTDHAEDQTDGTYNDRYITLDCHPLSFVDRSEAPFVNGIFTLAHVASLDVNDPPATSVRTDAQRPSLWTGTGGVIVSSTPALNDLWEVQADATAPVVSRSLVSIYFDRLAAYAGATSDYFAEGAPECYLYDKANMDPKHPTEVVQTEEDITSWMRYAYLRVGFVVPSVTLPAELTMTVYWYDVTITDNHLTGSTRQEEFDWETTSRSASYAMTFAATGSQYVDVDLLSTPTEQESVKLRHVYKVEFSGFPLEAGTWELETLQLRQHVTDSFRYAKFAEPWTYTGVGWSMVVDGKVSCLALPDNFHQNAEDGLEILNWSIGATTGLDLTTAFTLQQLANILENQEGLTCTYTEAEWDAHFTDEDDVTLCTAYPWLCSEDEDRNEDGATANWDWPIAARANQITIPRGITYRIEATKILQCGAHGIAWLGTERYPSVTVYIWRRMPGGGDWQFVDTCETNDLGYYAEGELKVLAVQGEDPPDGDVKWEYGVSLDDTGEGVASLGSGFNREWVWQRTAGSTIYYPNLCRDKAGQVWRVAADLAGRLYVAYLGADATAWTDVAQPFAGGVGYAWPSIAAFGDGAVVVAATIQGEMRLARTRDRGTTWTELTMATLGEGLEYGDIAQRAGKLWLCGWDAEKVWLAMSSNTNLTREELTSGTYLLEVAAAPSGDIIPRSSLVQVDDASVIVVIGQVDGTMETYQLRDPDTGFVAIA